MAITALTTINGIAIIKAWSFQIESRHLEKKTLHKIQSSEERWRFGHTRTEYLSQPTRTPLPENKDAISELKFPAKIEGDVLFGVPITPLKSQVSNYRLFLSPENGHRKNKSDQSPSCTEKAKENNMKKKIT